MKKINLLTSILGTLAFSASFSVFAYTTSPGFSPPANQYNPTPGYISPPPTPPAVNSDGEITKRVENSLGDNPALANVIVRVSTYEGIVTLEGTVRTQTQADQAVSTARNVAGVESVVSHLTVQEEGPIQ